MLYALFALFVLLSVLDGITTYQALQRSGSREENPIMAFLFSKFGVIKSLVVIKIGAISAIWMMMGEYSIWVIVGINIFYAFVVWHNHYRVGR